MALAGAAVPDRQPSPGLSSNNPFRHVGASSTSPRSPTFPNSINTKPPMSKNPFLDASELSPKKSAANGSANGLTASPTFSTDIFKDLSLLDKPGPNLPPTRAPPPRSGTMPVSGHRPVGSGERPRGPPKPNGEQLDTFNSSPKRENRHPRRNSESSVMEREKRSERRERTEDDDERRRQRRKEREERHRREKEKIRNGGKPAKKQHGLDLIDKLDVTGIYGQGLFHHDGPFDACNPHRNSKRDKRAPMQAFPVGSANMALGGGGPVNSRLDLDKFHGRGEEGFADYSATSKPDNPAVDPVMQRAKMDRQMSFNPHDRVEQVHGPETFGLGTSTFLDGAPASKRALEARESEEQSLAQQNAANGGGLARKKSLAQRFRGISQPRRRGTDEYGNGPRITSPDARYNNDNGDYSPPNDGSMSAGGPARARYNKENEVNPFDGDYADAYDKKGTQIRIAEQERPTAGRARAPSSPGGRGLGLVRSVTADSSAIRGSDEQERTGGGGFLSRMRSLKGGRRARPERRAS